MTLRPRVVLRLQRSEVDRDINGSGGRSASLNRVPIGPSADHSREVFWEASKMGLRVIESGGLSRGRLVHEDAMADAFCNGFHQDRQDVPN